MSGCLQFADSSQTPSKSEKCHFRTFRMMQRRTRLGSKVDNRFSRAAGGAFPSSLPKVQIEAPPDRHAIYVSCGSRANEAGVY